MTYTATEALADITEDALSSVPETAWADLRRQQIIESAAIIQKVIDKEAKRKKKSKRLDRTMDEASAAALDPNQ